jgi:hypothetical protein
MTDSHCSLQEIPIFSYLPDSYKISDHHHSLGYEDGPWKGPGPPLLVVADF